MIYESFSQSDHDVHSPELHELLSVKLRNNNLVDLLIRWKKVSLAQRNAPQESLERKWFSEEIKNCEHFQTALQMRELSETHTGAAEKTYTELLSLCETHIEFRRNQKFSGKSVTREANDPNVQNSEGAECPSFSNLNEKREGAECPSDPKKHGTRQNSKSQSRSTGKLEGEENNSPVRSVMRNNQIPSNPNETSRSDPITKKTYRETSPSGQVEQNNFGSLSELYPDLESEYTELGIIIHGAAVQIYPELASMITSMLLELPLDRIYNLIGSQTLLLNTIEEAATVLASDEAKPSRWNSVGRNGKMSPLEQ